MTESRQISPELMETVLSGIDVGIRVWDVATGSEFWSNRLFELLDFSPGEVPATHDYFMNELLHPHFKEEVEQAVDRHFQHREPYRLEVQMRTKSGAYRWMETTGQAIWNEQGIPVQMCGSLRVMETERWLHQQNQMNHRVLETAGKIARMGAWEVDTATMTSKWSPVTYEIHEVDPKTYKPDVAKGIEFYHPTSRPVISRAVEEAMTKGKPWDVEVLFVTAKGREIWVRAIGWPVHDRSGKVSKLQGVFQDIDAVKRHELELQRKKESLEAFAHIVTHNLRNHSFRLTGMLQLFNNAAEEEKGEMMDRLQGVAAGLKDTVDHLSELVNIGQMANSSSYSLVSLQDIYRNAKLLFSEKATEVGASIQGDFTEVPEVQYIPAFLQSIFENMISNSLKYRSDNRPLVVRIRSTQVDGQCQLSFWDNGSGIDLAKYSKKMFGMYQTFHSHEDAHGLGLFLTRNQVEAMGGQIKVHSEKDKFTEFTILLGPSSLG